MTAPRQTVLAAAATPPRGSLRPWAPAFRRLAPASAGAPAGPPILVAEDHRVPLVNLIWAAPAGARHEPAEKAGLAGLVAPLLKADRPQTEADILPMCDWDKIALGIGILTEDLGAGVELLADLVASPTFAPAPFDAWRRGRLHELARRRHSPAALADEVWNRAVFAGTRFAAPLPGDRQGLEALTPEDAEEYHRRRVAPGRGFLVAVGDVRGDDLARRVESAFPAVEPAEAAATAIEAPAVSGRRVILVDLPGAAQTQLSVDHASLARTHPDFEGLELLNAVLGGSQASRLNAELRQRRGLTYHVRSSLAARGGPAPFVVQAAVGTAHAGAALGQMLSELERLRREAVPESELEAARGYLSGVFLRRFQRFHDLGSALIELELHGLADDSYAHYPERIRRLDGSSLPELARRHLHPDRATIVACGPAAELRSQLADLGEVTELEIHQIDSWGSQS